MSEIRFGTDGWRGVIAEDMTFANVRLVARAIGATVRADAGAGRVPLLLVGHDTRFLSREFAQAAADALAAQGVTVKLAAAFAPTPAFSYAVVREGADGGVVITASHNPPEYNGVKFKSSYGGSAPIEFTRRVEARIRELQASAGCRVPRAETGGEPRAGSGHEPSAMSREPATSRVGAFDAREPWLDRLEELVDLRPLGQRGLHVALDVMYGAGQGLLAGRLRRAGCDVRELHAEPNPAFGGLHPEPIPAYMGDLIECVKGWTVAPRAGFAFDGDSDRLAPVDEGGRVITPHETLALLLRHLTRHRGWRGPVVKSVNIGRMVEAEAARLGLPVIVTPVGFKHIAEAMRAHDALVGGEESGGFAVRGHIPERDPGLISLLLLEAMALSGKTLGALVRELEADHGPHRYGRLDLRLRTLAERDQVVAAVASRPPDPLLAHRLKGVETLDGVKLTLADGRWIMLRASGTEPLLRIYAEAPSDAEVEALLAWGRERVNAEGGECGND
jgi:phosphomannomutase